MTTDPTRVIALLCTAGGTILEVVRDELGLGTRAAPGGSFTGIVNAEGVGKALRFLHALRTERAAVDWELTVPLDQRAATLHFAGATIDPNRLLIVGTPTRVDVEHFLDELQRVNNEQATALRALMQGHRQRTRARAADDSTRYDDLMRLTNELGTLQRELAKKNVELERLNEQKNQFLGMAAHDLRNPLGVINGLAEALIEDTAERLNPEEREFLDLIRTSSAFMLRLVNGLLDITRIDAGKLELTRRECDLVVLVHAHLKLGVHLAGTKGISLTGVAPPEPVIALVDPDRFEEVLNNLVGNAIKYSPRDSHIEVRVAGTVDEATVAVRDEGPGIPAAEVADLFAPFRRTSAAKSSGEPGVGLGLAIVHKIVTALGGRITVDSCVGSGSTFTVHLPRVRESGRGADASSPVGGAGAAGP